MGFGRTVEPAAKKTALFAIAGVSGFFRALGWQACRFHPTCSRYARDAYAAFGFWKATRLVVGRLFRCHPFCEGGHDPVLKEKE